MSPNQGEIDSAISLAKAIASKSTHSPMVRGDDDNTMEKEKDTVSAVINIKSI